MFCTWDGSSSISIMDLCSLLIWFVLVDAAVYGQPIDSETKNVSCSEDAVYIGVHAGLIPANLSTVLAVADGGICRHEESNDIVKLHGCQKNKFSPLRIYRFENAESVDVTTVVCFIDDTSPGRFKEIMDEVGVERRRRDSTKDNAEDDIGELWLLDAPASTHTSIVFTVKLKYSSNDEIFIACNPDNSDSLYLTNPDSTVYKSVLAFDEQNFLQCIAEFYNDKDLVMVRQCDLNKAIIVSFNKEIVHSPIIGGASHHFKIYKIECAKMNETEKPIDFINIEDHGHQTDISVFSIFSGLVIVLLILIGRM